MDNITERLEQLAESGFKFSTGDYEYEDPRKEDAREEEERYYRRAHALLD